MAAHTPDEVLAELQPIFREALDSPELVVTRASSATNTRNWDSLAHVVLIEIVMAHFHIRIGISELEDLHNVGDLVDLVVEKT